MDTLATILKDTYSLTQLKHRARILKSTILNAIFNNNQPPTYPPSDLNWLKSLPQDFYQKFNKDNVYNIFTELEQKTTKLNTLTIYLSFEPDETALTQIGTYSRKLFGFPTLLLDIKINPNLIAGTALVWKGILRDYSLKAQIEAKKGDILQEFKKFLR